MDYGFEQDWLLSLPAAAVELGGYFGGSYFEKRSKEKLQQAAVLRNKFAMHSAAIRGGASMGWAVPHAGLAIEADKLTKKYTPRMRTFRSIKRAALGLSVVSAGAWGFSLFDSAFAGKYGTRRGYTQPVGNNAGYDETAFFDTRAAFTQRQRALMVIHNSQLSNRAAFGQEASFLHM
jgi:hypothetical protein